MKTKVKRLSKRTLAMFLGVLMLITSIGVGSLITADSFTGTNTVYFKDTANWGSVYVYFYSKEYWDYGGSAHGGSKSSGGCVAGPLEMTQYSGDIYSYTYSGTWTYIAFTKDSQSDYDNFWNTSLVPCNNGYSTANPMCSPGTTTTSVNSCTDYTGYSWSALPAETYTVTCSSGLSHGSISSDVDSATEGDTVTITGTPDSGYKLSTVTVTKEGGGTVTTSGSGNSRTFEMPAENVTVTATFEAIPATTIYVKQTLASTFSNIHIWSNTSDNWTGAWPGQALSGWSSTTDGKYYYKSFNQDYSTFKFILNNNSSPQTSDSTAYPTGKSYYIDSATANSPAVLTEGVPQANTITYNTGTGYTIGGTKPTSAYTGDTVSFTVTASSGYRIDKVQYTPAGGTATTITASSGTYSFTMPDSAVTVSVTAVQQFTVTLTADTGFATKQYQIDGGTLTDYSSAITVDSGSTVVFSVTYTTGYEYDSSNSTLNGATAASSNTTFTLSNIAADTTVTLAAKKITYSGLTAVGKYSTTAADDASYSNEMSSNPATIADTSATQVDGVSVSAPATDPTGYEFAGWYTTTGSFSNAADKDTTFYPNAANAVAIAKYKKIFTITSSVDSSGKGAGTVTTDKTSVEAGGSYTITATPKSGSAIESIKVNNGTGTTTSPRTVSSVSADQTVVVKFKSNVYLKGTMNSTAWAGDEMEANSAGTSYSITDVVLNADTTYQFRLYADDEWKANSVDTWTLNGIATNGTSGDNLTITPSVKAKVTFVSDGSKFTSITAIPYDSTTYNVTLTQSADYTITSTYMGVEYTTSGKNANVTVPVYSGTGFSYTVTPASGKYLSEVAQSDSVALSPAFSATTHANSYTGTVSSVSNAFAVSATAASKLNVVAKTNKSARGTVSVSPETAYPGQTVTITVSPKNGVLKTLTYTYGTTTETLYPNNNNNAQAQRSVDGIATFAFRDKVSKLMTSATAKLFSGADSTYTFTMPSSAVTVNAVFDAYSGESTWYYNGYDNSGNALSGYHTKQMTEGMVSGEKFSYYHVEGRTGTDQLMTVSDGVPGSGDRYVYFVRPTDWGDGWSASNNPRAHFWNDTTSQTTWPGNEMTWAWNNDYGQGVYKTKIPTGAKYVKFNDNNGKQTVSINLTTTGGAYYLAGGGSGTDSDGYHIAEWNTGWADQGWVESGTEYFYQNSDHNGDYTGDFNTKGFYNHNTANKEFAKPQDLGTNTGDYYINVLYPNTTYTINGVTKTTGSNPMIIWSAEPLAGDDETTTIYAKDGSIRSEAYGSTYANIADTKIYAADGTTTVGTQKSGNITNQTYETYKAAKGDTIVIKTQIGATDSGTLSNAADLKAKYYVRGFCVNGEVSELLEWNADGLYTLTYKVPEDEDLSKIEITPIYYLKDTEANPIVTYRVTGFTDELKAVGSGKPNWGNTLYTYPFYGKLGSNNNALGAYPGQPMVYYKGQYQMQIPQKSTVWDIYYDDSALSGYSGDTAKANAVANTNVSGVTMSNGYYDIVHRQIAGFGDNSASADHVQTYDYGDFFKIFNEKKPVDNIVFDFKYETTTHNFETTAPSSPTPSNLTSTYQNGFELLTNFHGRTVDLFGTPLSGDAADPSKTTPVYVVSIGGVNGSAGVENIAGYYATEWMVYGSSDGSSYSRITAGGKNSIPPEVLVLNDDDDTSFNTTTYPSADANHTLTDWKDLYTALEAYRGKPVMISYEAADAQIGSSNYATSGGGGATRNDGRWLYSKNGENITGKIKIQYSDDNGANYTDLDTEEPQVTGLSAYFTNDGVEGEMTYATTIDPDKTFDFEAKTTNANYKFVGWYMEDGTKITTDNASHTERSGSYTFVAKFMQVTTGQLILSHSADKGTISGTDYQGEGTAKIGVVVKNGDEVVRTYDLSTSDITLDDKIIKSDNSDYTIEVTLEATATGNDTLGTTVLANPSGQEAKFYKNPSITTVDKTNTIVLDSFTVGDLFTNGTTQNVKNIIYHSYFNQAVFNYNVTFSYTDRTGAAKSYTRQGKLSSNQAANESYVSDDNGTKKLLPAFIKTIAPHVSNFGQTITWNFDNSGYAFTNSGSIYTCTASISATQTSSNKRNVTFVLPYEHTNGIASLDSNGIGTYASETVNFALTGNNAVTFESIPTLLNGGENHIFDENGKKNWIAAPKVIKDGNTQKFFKYWTIKTTSGRDVAKCYFNGFNYAALDNYVVTAEYDTVQTSSVDSDIFTDATYLETSRNQWNDNKDRTKTEKTYAADLLLNDFIVNYNYRGVDIYKNDSSSNAVEELGIVVERVKVLDVLNQDGSYNTDMSNYQDTTQDLDKVKSVINGTTQTGFTKHSIEKTALDNKNRYQVYDAFYNGAGWDVEKQTSAAKYTYKNYVYRIYSYMKYTEDGETKIALAKIPSYFTMYDEATKSYPLS